MKDWDDMFRNRTVVREDLSPTKQSKITVNVLFCLQYITHSHRMFLRKTEILLDVLFYDSTSEVFEIVADPSFGDRVLLCNPAWPQTCSSSSAS